MALTPQDVPVVLHSMKNLLESWMRNKLAIQKAFGKGPITKEQENAFLKLKSDLSRLYRQVAEKLPDELQFDGQAMIEMMKNATTMQHMHGLPPGEKRNYFAQWHRLYVLMSRTYGALEVVNEGYYPQLHRDLMKPKGERAKSKKKKKKSKK
jgi:hypothetical protein